MRLIHINKQSQYSDGCSYNGQLDGHDITAILLGSALMIGGFILESEEWRCRKSM